MGFRKRLAAAVAGALMVAGVMAGPTVVNAARSPGGDLDQLGDLAVADLARALEAEGLVVLIQPEPAVAVEDTPNPDTGKAVDDEWDDWADDDWVEDDWADDDWADDDWAEDDWADDDWADDEGEIIGAYDVDGDSISLNSGADSAAGQAIWQRFVELIPADQREMVASFEYLTEDFSGAFVEPLQDDPTKWVMGVGAGMHGAELDFTLIHEFGHLLTLNASQVPPAPDTGYERAERTCATYFTGEGCSLPGSTFARFVARFWPEAMLDEAFSIDDDRSFEAFYDRYGDRFVTDYAATNPGEDLAETFAVFVTSPRPDGTSVADQKVHFLWDDPVMVELREAINAAR